MPALSQRRTTRDVKGYVLETVGDVLSTLGSTPMVFIDRGRNQGFKRQPFTVFTRGDGYAQTPRPPVFRTRTSAS